MPKGALDVHLNVPGMAAVSRPAALSPLTRRLPELGFPLTQRSRPAIRPVTDVRDSLQRHTRLTPESPSMTG
jgi:hypothetical protein